MIFLLLDIFRVFGSGFCLLGVFLVCYLFLGLVGDGFCASCPAYPPRSVSGLVWVIGPLICGTGRVFRVGLGVFRFVFPLVFDIDFALFHSSSSPPPPPRVT